eukprot:m.190287 g.190287  ORF g.190287 m.190287 type:complete len:78 (-) comp16754_c1_seq2:105-338(-)
MYAPKPNSSMRERTHAHRKLVDDVPEDVKLARLNELIQVFHTHARTNNLQRHGTFQTVLVEAERYQITSKTSAIRDD